LHRATADNAAVFSIRVNHEIPDMVVQLAQWPGKKNPLCAIIHQQGMYGFNIVNGGFTDHRRVVAVVKSLINNFSYFYFWGNQFPKNKNKKNYICLCIDISMLVSAMNGFIFLDSKMNLMVTG